MRMKKRAARNKVDSPIHVPLAELIKRKGKRRPTVISDGNDAYSQRYHEVSLTRK